DQTSGRSRGLRSCLPAGDPGDRRGRHLLLGGCSGDDHGRSLLYSGGDGSFAGIWHIRGDHIRPICLSGEEVDHFSRAVRHGREAFMRPINTTILEVVTEAPQIRTLRLDRDLDPYPGQYVMVW